MLYICVKFCVSNSKDFGVTDSDSRVDARVVTIYKRALCIKTVYKVTILYLCILSDNASYLHQVSRKYFRGLTFIERMGFA